MLSIIYYSACRAPFAGRVRSHLPNDYPIISVTHQPIDLGSNIVFHGDVSTWSLYKQILLGAEAASTKYVAMAEDDILYAPEHFAQRPTADDVFAYNLHRYWLEPFGDTYRFRLRPNRVIMGTCIVNRAFLVETLTRRFEKFPNPYMTRKELTGWGEPGRMEWYLNLPRVSMEKFRTGVPCIQINHKLSLGGMRRANDSDTITNDLPYWGKAVGLWNSLCNASETAGSGSIRMASS